MIIIWESGLYSDPWGIGGGGLSLSVITAPTGDPVPIGACQAEILYSIPISAKSNLKVFRKDSMEWGVVQKSEVKWRHEYVTFRYRVHDTFINEFYQFHVSHKGQIVSLSTPGLQPFIRASEVNSVFIVDLKRPSLEFPKHYNMSVTYMREGVLP